MANHKIHIPDKKLSWPIKHNDSVTFTFDADVTNFKVDHPKYFNPPVASGGFAKGNSIGPYTSKVSQKNVIFSYDNQLAAHAQPAAAPLLAADTADDPEAANSHTILIGN